MSKRRKFVVTTILLTLGFLGVQLLDNQYRLWAILALALSTLVLFAWSLIEGLGKNATLLTLVLPFFFTLGVGLFWFLLPSSVLTRLPVLLIYAAGIYSLCLTTNVFTVSAIRSIGLIRAARGVGFVLTIFTSFLLFDSIFSLRMPVYVSFPLVYLTSLPLFLQGLWIITLTQTIEKEILLSSAIFALILAEITLCLFFWPVTVVVGSLFLTLGIYVLLGLGQAKVDGRLFIQTIKEYMTIGLLVFIGMLFATKWG